MPSRMGGRFAELSGGIIFCSGCGRRMVHMYSTGRTPGRRYFYYKCPTMIARGKDACPAKKTMISAPNIEAAVWKMISAASDERRRVELINTSFDQKTEFLRRLHGDLSSQTRLTESLAKLDRRRDGYLDQQAEGLITMEELKGKLASVAEQREAIQGELDSAKNKQDQLARLLSMRDMLVDGVRNGFLDKVARDNPEERHALYKRMGLRVELDNNGRPIISGGFGLLGKEKTFSREHPTPCRVVDA